jgi:hypothetical protein
LENGGFLSFSLFFVFLADYSVSGVLNKRNSLHSALYTQLGFNGTIPSAFSEKCLIFQTAFFSLKQCSPCHEAPGGD